MVKTESARVAGRTLPWLTPDEVGELDAAAVAGKGLPLVTTQVCGLES